MAKKNDLKIRRNDEDNGSTVVVRQYPDGNSITTKMSNDEFDDILTRAASTLFDDDGKMERNFTTVQNRRSEDHVCTGECSCGGECKCGGKCNGECKCGGNCACKEKPIHPIIEYTKGSYPGYDGESVRVMVDKAYMSTGCKEQPVLPCNIICDDNNGRIITEVPDAEGKSWYATLDRPCFVGSNGGCYGIFIPWSCGAESLYATGQLLMDVSENAKPEIDIPFIGGYFLKK